ncbi:MAG: P-II family nitrogen regulator [Bacteroidales bacterium]|nr:P-II family nitrogen regulator [Bacteroidales bacterium]
MKTIMAIIRIDKMNETKEALIEAEIDSFMATGRVFGRGKGKYDAKVLEGVKEGVPEAIELMGPEPRLRPQRLLTIIVNDNFVKPCIDAIMKANRTDTPGDGKIFVLPLEEAYRVRTGESGTIVV